LHQISLAAHAYAGSNNGMLPPGSCFDSNSFQGSWVGALTFLLPYMEQTNVWNQIPQYVLYNTQNNYYWNVGWFYYATTAAQNKIPAFLCPADGQTNEQPSSGYVFIMLTVQPGYFVGYLYPYSAGFGLSNYVPNGGTAGAGVGFDTWTGPYANQPVNGAPFTGLTLATITNLDGTANTVAFGETLGGASPNRDYLLTWMGAGCMAGYWGLPVNAQWYTYGSMHDGVVNFGFCDGSVRTFRKGVALTAWNGNDWFAFQEAMGYKDGATPNWSLISN
jgi:prepilin-type processing-associated H-X9-DG protein